MGFTRGLNRFVIWFWGQVFALIFAIVAWVSATRRRAHLPLGRAPLLAFAVEVLIFGG